MKEWRATRLGDCLEVHHGFAFKGEYFRDQGELIVLTPGNFFDEGGFKPKSGKEKYYDGPVPPKYLLRAGDVVVAMTEQVQGLLGSTATIPEDGRYLHNQRLGLLEITDTDVLDLRFTYHLLNGPDARRQLQATATGAKIRHTAPERITAVEVRLPDVPTQKRVAAILDSLDALIETNWRRVKLLDEMARVIYREWFVHFRYPGHEDVRLVDSPCGPIPDSWNALTFGDVLELRYGRALKKGDRRGGSVAVVSSAGVVGWHDEALVTGPTIVVGRKGNVGSITWVDGDAWPIDTAYFVDSQVPLRYLAEQLRRTEFLNTHAAIPGLSRDQAYSRPFLRPTVDLMNMFDTVSGSLAAEASALTEASARLGRLRDLVLPRLVTGRIEVSQVDADALTGPAVA